MRIEASSVADYVKKVQADRQKEFKKLRKVIKDNIPPGFKEQLSYGMIGYVVPHSKYPDGYHVKPELPLPFCNIGNQKNFIGLYHSGIYTDTKLSKWFIENYAKHCKSKLDMGKSCVRLKKMDDIPFDLIGELMTKITVDQWIALYEKALKK